MIYLKIIHLKDQLWTVITRLLSVLILADPFYSSDFNLKNISAKIRPKASKICSLLVIIPNVSVPEKLEGPDPIVTYGLGQMRIGTPK